MEEHHSLNATPDAMVRRDPPCEKATHEGERFWAATPAALRSQPQEHSLPITLYLSIARMVEKGRNPWSVGSD